MIDGPARMQVVASWTGGRADLLRQALRMTNESFAEHLGVAVRTVAYWRKRPETIPIPAMQETLDAALERVPDRAKAQFAMLISQAGHDKRSGYVESFELPGGALLGASPGADPEFGDSEYLQSI